MILYFSILLTSIYRLQKIRPSLKYCKPLVDALLGGVRQRFGDMMSDPELIAAAILHPKFRLSWATDDVLQLGEKFYIPSFVRF